MILNGTDITKEQFLACELKDISSSYCGLDNHCRCGCGGKYLTTTFSTEQRSRVSDTLVAKRLEKAKRLILEEDAECYGGDTYFNVCYNENTALCFYFDEIKQ